MDPNQPFSVVEQLYETTRPVDGEIEFGDPQDPANPSSTTLAGSSAAAHAGNVQNMLGSWGSALITTGAAGLNAAIRFHHNLDCPVSVAGRPNVRWLHFYFEHDGWDGAAVNSATGVSVISCNFQTGDTVSATAIDLRFYAALPRVVSAAHPLRVDLFFVPAVSR